MYKIVVYTFGTLAIMIAAIVYFISAAIIYWNEPAFIPKIWWKAMQLLRVKTHLIILEGIQKNMEEKTA
jgi:hypothetical protein